jgi:manganese/zinc/iron transport system permease protein
MDLLIDLLPLSYTDSVVALGALVLGGVAGVLGTFAVLPGRSMVGDALAHAALPGVCVAFLVTGAKDAGSLLAGAAIAGLIGAALILTIERGGRLRSDAAIGVVLASFFAVGIVLLTAIANTNDADQAGLERYLFGQAAGLSERDVRITAGLGLAAVAVVVAGFRPLKTALFDREFAGSAGLPVRAIDYLTLALLVVAVVIGVRMVGAILMVAMLVVPPVVARQLTGRLALLLPLAAVVGAGVGVGGALLSAKGKVPTGPVIVLLGFAAVVLAILLAPGRGIAWRGRRLARERRRALAEGVLLDLETALHGGPPPTEDQLLELGGRSRRALRRGLRDLDGAGMLARDGARLLLTERGAAAAHAQIERRRLWSAWLEHGWRLELPDARDPDPRDLRTSLGPDATARLLALAGAER